jgi:glucose dehydrogenase
VKPLSRLSLACVAALGVAQAHGQSNDDVVPVTAAMLESPAPADWLHFSRPYDAQRYSPLDQIDRENGR